MTKFRQIFIRIVCGVCLQSARPPVCNIWKLLQSCTNKHALASHKCANQWKQPRWQRKQKYFLKFAQILYFFMHNTTGVCVCGGGGHMQDFTNHRVPWVTPICIYSTIQAYIHNYLELLKRKCMEKQCIRCFYVMFISNLQTYWKWISIKYHMVAVLFSIYKSINHSEYQQIWFVGRAYTPKEGINQLSIIVCYYNMG